jgi:hypothetical protein
VRELLALPVEQRMTVFAEKMIALRDALAAAHPRASRRDLASLGQELGLAVLHRISAAAHRAQLAAVEKMRAR